MRAASGALASAVIAAAAATAGAQGYEVVATTGRIEPRPADATRVDVSSAISTPARSAALVRLPFPFRFYGVPCTEAVVSPHGWMLPGAREGFADPADPVAAHGQDPASGAFPYGPGGASADGVLAVLWTRIEAVADGTPSAGEVASWVAGVAPARRFVVSWENVVAGTLGRTTFQVQLLEADGAIVLAYAVGSVTGADRAPSRWVSGLDERGGRRFTAPVTPGAANAGPPPGDVVLVPRAAWFGRADAPQRSRPPSWSASRLEALRGPDGANTCWYVADGVAWFWVPDRAVRGRAARAQTLRDEDRATFPSGAGDGPGDAERCVRQVLDGKAVLVPGDGGPPLRLWFRVIEFVTIDDRGLAGPDDHVWNLRVLLSMALPAEDPRSRIGHWAAWRASASSRLTVGKLFDARQTDDSGPQFDTGRVGESVNWCARLRLGHRGAMPRDDCPAEGWVRLPMRDRDQVVVQHADRRDVRFVPDPNYVDSGYEYVVVSDDAPDGWISRLRPRPTQARDEPFEADPPDPPR